MSPTSEHDPSVGRGWLMRAKLEAPRQQIRLVSRPRLLALLDETLDRRLGVVVAPAGFGKSTLLAQWRTSLLTRALKVGWISLDEADGDAHQFLSHVIFSLEQAGVAMDHLSALAAQGLQDLSPEAGLIAIHERVGRDDTKTVLILDDYHRLHSAAVDELVLDTIMAGPPNLHLVITGRAPPSLHLPSLTAAGRALEVTADALRLSRAEVRDAFGTTLTEEALEALCVRTEGWAVAVQLARLLFDGRCDSVQFAVRLSGERGHIAAYLADQVLATLSEDLQDILMQTSVLERFNASLAQALCQRKDAWEAIKNFEPLQALVVPTDSGREWIRYHHLFAECLQDLLRRRHPGRVCALHTRAADWYEAHGYVPDAVRHAGLAQNFDRCAHLIEQAGGWELILFGGIGYLRNLLRHIPQAEVARFPRIRIAKAYLCLKDGHVREARALLDSVPRAAAATGEAALARDLLNVEVLAGLYDDSVGDLPNWQRLERLQRGVTPADGTTRGVILCVQMVSSLALGRFAEAHRLIRQAKRAMRRAGTVLGLNYCYLHAGLAAFYCADLRRAAANYREARHMAAENFGRDSGLRNLADVLYGALLFWQRGLAADEHRRFSAALQHVMRYDGWFEIYANGLEVAVERSLRAGDAAQAFDALRWTERVAQERDLPRLADLAQALRLRVLAALPGVETAALAQTLAAVERSLEAIDLEQHPHRWRVFIDSATALARVRLASDPSGSLRLLEAAVAYCRRLGARFHLVRALVDNACALEAAGERDQAVERLLEAATLAAPQELRGPFCGRAELTPLLRRMRKTASAQGLGRKLEHFITGCLSLPGIAWKPSRPDGVALSPRETEVLAELALGGSNRDIAQALDMTENTVKFHLKKIYTKLAVDRRVQAVAEARRRGIISATRTGS